jgi:RNA polymerase sigma-70 factor (ECF subfamily)
VCGDGHVAEDVTAETFLAAWKNRAAIADSTDPIGPWLLAIATRQSLNAVRGRRRQLRFVARHGHRFEDRSADHADLVAARVDGAAAVARTRAALDRLDAKEVEVLVMCVWSAVSTRDAAAALGVAEGTVRSRLSRARRKLRDLSGLSGSPDEPPERLRTRQSPGRASDPVRSVLPLRPTH